MYAHATSQGVGKKSVAIPTWAAVWFAALMVLTLSVRIADATGWLGSDDASYHSAAEHVLAGQTIQRVHHHYARMAVVVPVAASMWLLGESPFTVVLPMLIASTLCVIVVVVLGRVLWGWWEGLLAATIVSVLPYFRVLSTTAFPDVHVCLWATAAILLAILATRTVRVPRAAALWGACGFALGLAISAKVFAIAVCVGIGWILWKGDKPRMPAAALLLLGLLSFQLLEGIFYFWAADDFFFSLRATLAAQSNVPSMAAEAEPAKWTATQMVWDRLVMLLHPTTSGWGWIGVVFWPVVLAALLVREARGLALWALATYFLVAFVPISFKEGAQPYPVFHGRHVLPACVPFALCFAWMLRRVAGLVAHAASMEGSWPIAFAAMVALSFANPRELGGFRDRATSRVGIAIAQLVESTEWDRDHCIFMSPSLYWRFRILFPQELRPRLRVAANDTSPTWWRDTCGDIASRLAPLPPPGDAYLIATPAQLRGESEQWDYGVRLPREQLAAWQTVEPRAGICRFADKTIGPSLPGMSNPEPFLLLLGGVPSGPDHLAEQATLLPSQLRVPPNR